ncbi:Uncharacterized protein Rs2_46011 [Raphanus sativus]|uniref:Uncharacterized protein LOC108821355 n=1 Tax=Raphanus sativus TaxID=3726 RepID=A0A6J0KQM9_RAPSA|nr:uncharacterized protein LOC108821355 [Raphanus sativus]KAJ4872319.1 Uncharacterized protein Rs2_46011 [Raphanus sativus]
MFQHGGVDDDPRVSPAAVQLTFRGRLTEGSVYTLSGFDVTRSNPKFKLTDGPVAIRFNEGTEFEKLATTTRMIPTEHFRFRTYEQIRELANTGKQLPDVMGELRAIRSTITDCLPGAQRVMLNLRLDGGVNVCVSMFDSLALAFHSKFDGYGREPMIVLVTAINPKIVSGNLYLNGTSATRVFFDCETTVGAEAFNRLPGGGTDQGESSTKVVHAQKIEPLTIAELNKFVLTGDPQIIEFLCTAKVTEVKQDEGWCYIGCSVCSKKLNREESSFTCVSCNQTNAVAELRYRVVFSVSDATGIAGFVGFDKEVAKLTHVLASEAAQIVGIGVNAEVDTELPRSLADIVGNIYTFQLKLKDFNFTANHQTFTVSRIFPARELAPIPNFAEGAEAPEPAIPPTVVPGQATTSTGLPGVESAGEGVDGEGSAPKKPRVE